MAAKKSLIVDDSKSARAVLKRMLEKLGLDVDTVESATDAIEYLENHIPDVIFMDHMMPEMDGFEAVKRIKDNPKTSVIPIMMYTSKAGDVYLSQARELGAVGIISKTISPVGLKESLFKLGLVDDRRIESTLIQSAPIKSNVDTQILAASILDEKNERDSYINDIQRLMDDQTIELHKSMWLGIESVSNEIFNRLRAERKEQNDIVQQVQVQKKRLSWPFYLVCFLLLLSIIFGVKLFNQNAQLENKYTDLKASYMLLNEQKIEVSQSLLTASEVAAKQRARLNFILWAHGQVIEYSFHELAFDDARLTNVEKIVNQAIDVNYRGKIILQSHVGEFCYNRNQGGEYELAGEDQPVTDCDYIGNDVQPSDVPSTHQSLNFVNYLFDMAALSEKGIIIEVDNASRLLDVVAYPEKTSSTKAGEWNVSAQKNNRVTISLQPNAGVY